jgi:hypothetical protein
MVMDAETIKKIAEEIVKHLSTERLALLPIQLLLMTVAGAVGAFFSGYFKTRGKKPATKADFETLESQLRANTELVETLKAEIKILTEIIGVAKPDARRHDEDR